jgi:hypothetical protein
MKVYADNNRSERSFQVGEYVLLKLQPYAQSSIVNRPFPKLAFKYLNILVCIRSWRSLVQWLLRFSCPDQSAIHPVVHVSQLKVFTPDHIPVFSQLPDIPALNISEFCPKKIINHRLVKKGNVVITQLLVQWTKLPATLATWEDYNMLKKFPSTAAWGQAAPSVGGTVANHTDNHITSA